MEGPKGALSKAGVLLTRLHVGFHVSLGEGRVHGFQGLVVDVRWVWGL